MKKLPRYKDCFICGCDNSAGADVQFYIKGEGVEGSYIIPEKYVGYKDTAHGGIISALLDECIAWTVCVSVRAMCVTGELNIKFKRPIPVNTRVIIKGFPSGSQPRGKKFHTGHGYIADEFGKIYAKGEGRYFPMPEEGTDSVMEILEFDDKPGEQVTPEDIWGSN